MNKKDASQKKRKPKNKRNSANFMGIVQTTDTKAVWEYMLHLRGYGLSWKQLAHWTLMGESISWGIPKIFTQGTTASMLQLQYKPRGNGGRLLRKNVGRNRNKRDGKVTARQKNNSESSSALLRINRAIFKTN